MHARARSMAEPWVVAVDVSGAQRTTNAAGVSESGGRVVNRDRLCVGALIAFIAAANVYRAATQGIVHDEATTYLMFIAGPLEHVFTRYTANNHVLFTFAANATTVLLGVTELTLRLPVGYCRGRLPHHRGSAGPPHVLDEAGLRPDTVRAHAESADLRLPFGSAWVRAGALLVRLRAPGALGRPERQRWLLASLALGGSVCANLAFAFPAVALWTTASTIAVKREPAPASARALITQFALPGLLVAAALLAVPLREARRETFFFGAESLGETARSIVRLAVEHHPTWWTNTSFAIWVAGALTWAAIITAIAASSASMIRLLRWRRFAPGTRDAHWLLFYGGTLTCTVILLTIAHHSAGVLYPKERTGLYFIPLIVLTLAGAAGSARFRTAAVERNRRVGGADDDRSRAIHCRQLRSLAI